MRYVSTDKPARFPQLLQIYFQQQPYAFQLMHAEDESYGERNRDHAIMNRVHAHGVFHIVLYTGGENRFQLQDGPHRLQRGTLVVTAPGEPHDFAPIDPGRVTSNELTFSYAYEQTLLYLPTHALLSLIAGIPLAPIPYPAQLDERQTRRVETLFALLVERLAVRDPFCMFTEQQIMYEVFSLLILDIYGASLTAHITGEDPLQKVRAEIDRRYADQLTVQELAQHVFLSGGYLIRAFKARFGIPPLAYQQAIRIRAAKTLLLTSSRSVTEIAGMVGYQDITSFSKMFKRTVGMSPRVYRAQHR